MRQWEIWKGKPAGFSGAHWFVILTPPERLASTRHYQANGLACFSLRGSPTAVDVVLNSAEGFAHATVCQCDLIHVLAKGECFDRIGEVSWERQQQIRSRVKALFRL